MVPLDDFFIPQYRTWVNQKTRILPLYFLVRRLNCAIDVCWSTLCFPFPIHTHWFLIRQVRRAWIGLQSYRNSNQVPLVLYGCDQFPVNCYCSHIHEEIHLIENIRLNVDNNSMVEWVDCVVRSGRMLWRVSSLLQEPTSISHHLPIPFPNPHCIRVWASCN